MMYKCIPCLIHFEKKESFDIHNKYCINYHIYNKHKQYISNTTLKDVRLLFNVLQLNINFDKCKKEDIIDSINDITEHKTESGYTIIYKLLELIINDNHQFYHFYSTVDRINIISQLTIIDYYVIESIIYIIRNSINDIYAELFN